MLFGVPGPVNWIRLDSAEACSLWSQVHGVCGALPQYVGFNTQTIGDTCEGWRPVGWI